LFTKFLSVSAKETDIFYTFAEGKAALNKENKY